MKVIEAAPYWIQSELRRMLGSRAMSAVGDAMGDEMRRLGEAVDWLNREVAPPKRTATENTSTVTADRALGSRDTVGL